MELLWGTSCQSRFEDPLKQPSAFDSSESAAANGCISQSLKNLIPGVILHIHVVLPLITDQDVGNEHLLNWRIWTRSITSFVICNFTTHIGIVWNRLSKQTLKNNGFVCVSDSRGVLRARLPRADQIALSLDDAPALHDDGVTEDPLQPPVSRDGALRALLHRLLERGRRYQLC